MSLRWIKDLARPESTSFKAIDFSRDNMRPDLMDQCYIGRMIMKKHIYFPVPCSEQAYQQMDVMVSRCELGLN